MSEDQNCIWVVFSSIASAKGTVLSKLLSNENGIESGFHAFNDEGRATVFAARVKKAGGRANVLQMALREDEYADDWWCDHCNFGPHGDADDSCLKCGKKQESRYE